MSSVGRGRRSAPSALLLLALVAAGCQSEVPDARLEFRASDRTLTDQEVAAVRSDIEAALAEVGGTIRG